MKLEKMNGKKDLSLFKKDREKNDVYFQWGQYGNGYIINDPMKKARLIDLEGYKHFFISNKPPILIPILVFALMIGVGVSFLTDYQGELKGLIGGITVVVYLVSIVIYFLKISRTLKGCERISKEEKEWIFTNKIDLQEV